MMHRHTISDTVLKLAARLGVKHAADRLVCRDLLLGE